MRKRIVLLIACCVTVLLAMNSCQTGYSKSSCIASFEKFVEKVEANYSDYDEKDWERMDKRMAAFEEKFDKYADKFTSEEKRKVSKLTLKYKYVRGKAKVKNLFSDLSTMVEGGISAVGDIYEDMETELDIWADSLESVIK